MFRERSTNHIHVSRLVIGVWLMNRFRRKRFIRVSRFTRRNETHTHSLTRGHTYVIVRAPECWCSVIVCGSIGIRRVIGIEPHTRLLLVPFHTDYTDCVSCLFACIHWVLEIFVAAWVVLVELQPNECVYTRVITAGCQPERCFPHKYNQKHTRTHACGVRYTSQHSQRGTRANKVTYSFRSTAAAIIKPDLHFTGNSLYFVSSLFCLSILCNRARSLSFASVCFYRQISMFIIIIKCINGVTLNWFSTSSLAALGHSTQSRAHAQPIICACYSKRFQFCIHIHAAMMHFVLKSPNRVLIVIISRPNKIRAHTYCS